jgi:hypothetical protein
VIFFPRIFSGGFFFALLGGSVKGTEIFLPVDKGVELEDIYLQKT